ncbi:MULTISPECIES: chemotaxis protein CheW [Heyndrickxia]|jgi:purine-binding chemotaxis protein CheW|uniref:Chemotaxis protein CheW n=1 Tax=Heyndrickxia oleronia TaxID=38875 RepID=A0AAW6SR37_9BACI|nr:chemotaxis protein CheW [Heyndrickxia oleronia]NYV67037.1 chemotaxis protein CheW [Bacillus sp. Gen3]OJH18111.1 chemotaxis protein CheW [Bacillus obstructivus]MBU5211135.1 chemotaxis protein CheW [Heyndrickxia oleronia]MCI1589599.1 chemotaxis protein CheW [Heyndrickxia oleronia]MCI1613310.1 chemotaxis protein CheW [Heyndrickxia oleronia]
MTDVIATENVKLIVFRLLDKEYAIPVQQVRAIEKVLHITRVPRTESFVKGVINLRGIVLPIIDLQKRFGIGKILPNDDTRIIIVQMETMEVGLLVDAANDVIDIPKEIIEPQPDIVDMAKAEFISGVAKVDKRLLLLINLEQVLSPLK